MTVAITGGGTGGHLAIAKILGCELKKRKLEIVYIGSNLGQDKDWFNNEYGREIFKDILFLDSVPVVGIGKIRGGMNVFKNIFKTYEVLNFFKKNNVDFCISVGGFSASSASFATLISRKQLFIHEQNATMGLLNKFLKPFCKGFFSSFSFENCIVSPYPVREDFFLNSRIRTHLKCILFLGGSQGAVGINNLALKLAPFLNNKNIKILHQTGNKNLNILKAEYEKLNFKITDSLENLENHDIYLFNFNFDLSKVMKVADFCIGRSGAGSLFELIANNLPTLFIPYPYASNDHQYLNVLPLLKQNLGMLKRENEIINLKTEFIMEEIMKTDLQKTSEGLRNFAKEDGAKFIIDRILEEIKK